MENIPAAFAGLTDSINQFKKEYKLHYPTDRMSDIWSVKDILCHITYWHRYYAKNLSAQASGRSYVFPRIPFYELNQRGVEKLRSHSDKNLFAMLTKANNKLKKVILSGKVHQITYRVGTVYTIDRFLFIIDRHIRSHTRQVGRKRKRMK